MHFRPWVPGLVCGVNGGPSKGSHSWTCTACGVTVLAKGGGLCRLDWIEGLKMILNYLGEPCVR